MREIELEGRVSSLSGSCPTISFRVDDRAVSADDDSKIRGGNCRDIRNGTEVEVKGMLLTDGTVRAQEIRIEDDD